MALSIGLSAWRLQGSWERRIAIASEHGLSALHIDLGGPGRDIPLEEPAVVSAVTHQASRKGIQVRLLAVNRLNDIGLCSTSPDDHRATMHSIHTAIHCASAAGIPYVMIPIFRKSMPVSSTDLSAIASKLTWASKQASTVGVEIVCENTLQDRALGEIQQQMLPRKMRTVFDCLNPALVNLDPIAQWEARRCSAIPDIHVKDQHIDGRHAELGEGIGKVRPTIARICEHITSPLFILEGDYLDLAQDRISADIGALGRLLAPSEPIEDQKCAR